MTLLALTSPQNVTTFALIPLVTTIAPVTRVYGKEKEKQTSVFNPHMSQIILRECTVSSNERLHSFPMHVTQNGTPTFRYVKKYKSSFENLYP